MSNKVLIDIISMFVVICRNEGRGIFRAFVEHLVALVRLHKSVDTLPLVGVSDIYYQW